MKTKLTLLLTVLLSLAAHAADDLSSALQKGLFEEEANQNLPAAIQAYQALLSASDDQRKLAATALFRLGECYRKLGQTNDAIAQYQRLISDFSDQSTLTTLSRQNLRGLGVSPTVTTSGNDPRASQAMTSEARTRLRELLQKEIGIAEQFAAEQRKRIETGTMAQGEEVRFERDVLGLKRQLVALDGLSLTEDRREWRELLLQEIALAEKAVSLERRKMENGRTAASEVARLQRDVLILKRELVAFESSPLRSDAAASQIPPAPSVEAEELARTERILAQLNGWDLSQLRRLIPQLVPDAEFDQLDKELKEFDDVVRRVVLAGQDKPNLSPEMEKDYAARKDRLTRRADEIVAMLKKRAAILREQVATEMAAVPHAGQGRGDREISVLTDEEEKEIRRIQALIKDSPDLINAPNVEVTKVRSGELMVPKNGTLLHKAARLGQLQVANHLLEHGADLSVRDQVGRMPLHWAAENGHKAMVELLLANKADVTAKISPGWTDGGLTTLHLAVKKGYRTVCETLLARGADPNLGDGSGAPPIYYAVSPGDEAILRLLVAKGANVNPPSGKKASTPLHNAETTNIAQILIDNGAVVDALNKEDQTPLHRFASSGKADVVELLLSAGANPRLKDREGKTPLHHAAGAWKAGVVAPLIAKGANPNERNSYGGAPLDAVIPFGSGQIRDVNRTAQVETLQALLAGGADPNLVTAGYAPQLFRAVTQGLEEAAGVLLKAGANPNAKEVFAPNSSQKGWTALIQALAKNGRSISLVNLLLENKADPSLPGGDGNPPLYLAIGTGGQSFAEKAPYVEALLKRGADIEGRNEIGNTPLAVAVDFKMKEMVELLLKHKADPNVKTGDGRPLLHLAAGNRNLELMDLLLTAGANPNALDAQGLSALDYVKTARSVPSPGGIRMISPPSAVPNFPGQPTSQRSEVSQSELADRLRKAGARDWAPRPGQITVTRRSTGASIATFTKGTNDWNRHSLLEVMGFTYFGQNTGFPFPDFSKLTITRIDPATGTTKEFSLDLQAKIAADGCKADQWLEWGDLIDIPEGEHKLGEKWDGLPSVDIQAMTKCLTRNVALTVKGKSKEVPLVVVGSWRSSHGAGANIVYYPERPFRLRHIVLDSGLLLTSSDTTRVKVTRSDGGNGFKEWTFDLSKEPSAGNDLWLRDGDKIEVPEK